MQKQAESKGAASNQFLFVQPCPAQRWRHAPLSNESSPKQDKPLFLNIGHLWPEIPKPPGWWVQAPWLMRGCFFWLSGTPAFWAGYFPSQQPPRSTLSIFFRTCFPSTPSPPKKKRRTTHEEVSGAAFSGSSPRKNAPRRFFLSFSARGQGAGGLAVLHAAARAGALGPAHLLRASEGEPAATAVEPRAAGGGSSGRPGGFLGAKRARKRGGFDVRRRG